MELAQKASWGRYFPLWWLVGTSIVGSLPRGRKDIQWLEASTCCNNDSSSSSPLPSCRKVEGSNPSTNTQRDSVAVHIHAISHIGQSLLSNETGRSNDRVTLTWCFSEVRTRCALGWGAVTSSHYWPPNEGHKLFSHLEWLEECRERNQQNYLFGPFGHLKICCVSHAVSLDCCLPHVYLCVCARRNHNSSSEPQ